MKKQLSIIVPVFNEEQIIKKTIEGLKKEVDKLDLEYEIIAVNDASTDKTEKVLRTIPDIQVVNHNQNKGYGASLKTGIERAKFENLLFFDADGQHKTEYIKEMIKHIDKFDMIAGARVGYKGPLIRQPGKLFLKWLSTYLSQQKIPDLNCGLRIVKKEKISKFLHLLCDGFSFSTTTILLFLTERLSVKYISLTINKRGGESKSRVKPKHAFDTFIIILRTILLSSPLRIFLPVSFLLFLGALASGIYDFFFRPFNLTDITIILFLSFLLIFFFGLIADQLAFIRKEIRK